MYKKNHIFAVDKEKNVTLWRNEKKKQEKE